MEGITVKPERKIREKWQQSGEGQEIDKCWRDERGLDKPPCCDNRDNTATNMSSEINISNLATVCSIKTNTNLNNQGSQLSSTHL